jgi:hypothetical protein
MLVVGAVLMAILSLVATAAFIWLCVITKGIVLGALLVVIVVIALSMAWYNILLEWDYKKRMRKAQIKGER